MTDTQIAPDGTVTGGMPEIPETLTMDVMLKMARDAEPFRVQRVSESVHPEYGISWQYLIRRKDGKQYDFSLWSNVKRDTLAQWIMAQTDMENVPPCVIKNGGSGSKPFFYVDKAP